MKCLNFIATAVDKMYHKFGVTKTAIVAGTTVTCACAGFVASIAIVPNEPIVEIAETIVKEN